MKKYFIYYPRNFANEYTIYSVTPDRMGAFSEFDERMNNDPNACVRSISRKEAYQKITEKYIREASGNYTEYCGGRAREITEF